MRRIGLMAILTLTLIATIASVSVAARPDAKFRASASTGHPGGRISVSAQVLHATRGTDFSATAVVHFSSGDVTVALKRSGHSFQAGTRVPVPAGADLGPVTIDVTITYGATSDTITLTRAIRARHVA